ncbi:MAG TPA: ABC transporter permease [Dehalococcoidia bacterium]|nr:ABC transporter permease [Dehalococcoidia bacterium]
MTELGQVADSTIYPGLWRARLGLLFKGLRQNWSLFADSRIGVVGLAIIVFFGLMVVSYPLLKQTVWNDRGYDSVHQQNFEVYNPVTGYDLAPEGQEHPLAPSTRHLLGTDILGRDVLSQLMFSAKDEFVLGLTAALVTAAIATLVGAMSAYYGGIVDTLLMRLADLLVLFPLLSLLIVFSALAKGTFFELGLLQLGLILGIFQGFGATAIILKSQGLAIKVKPYIDAARMAGGGHVHIILSHFIPNLLPLAFLYMMFTVTAAIFTEAVLSFFGLLDISMSWGIMINTTKESGFTLQFIDKWWLIFPASLAITMLCSAFYLVGRGLDEVVNPRLRRR